MLADVGGARDGPDSDVLVDEVLSSEVNEGIVRLELLVLLLFDALQLGDGDRFHRSKHFDQVIFFGQLLFIEHRGELLADSLRPARHLIIHEVDLPVSLLKGQEVLFLLLNSLPHFHDLFIISELLTIASICRILARAAARGGDLELVELGTQVLIVPLELFGLLISITH